MKVRSLISERSGNAVANQFVIEDGETTWFQSYNSIIAKREFLNGALRLTLDCKYWDYSRTTARYRNQFTGLTTEETKKLIRNGEIKLEDLNV